MAGVDACSYLSRRSRHVYDQLGVYNYVNGLIIQQAGLEVRRGGRQLLQRMGTWAGCRKSGTVTVAPGASGSAAVRATSSTCATSPDATPVLRPAEQLCHMKQRKQHATRAAVHSKGPSGISCGNILQQGACDEWL